MFLSLGAVGAVVGHQAGQVAKVAKPVSGLCCSLQASTTSSYYTEVNTFRIFLPLLLNRFNVYWRMMFLVSTSVPALAFLLISTISSIS